MGNSHKAASGEACPAVWSWSDPMPALEDWRGSIRRAVGELLRGIRQNIRQTGRRIPLPRLAEFPGRPSFACSVWHRFEARLPSATLGGCPFRPFCLSGQHHSQRHGGSAAAQIPTEGSWSTRHRGSLGRDYRSNLRNGLTPRSRAIATEFGTSLEHHRLQRLTPELIDQADLIFITDHFNEARMLDWFWTARAKVFYLGPFGEQRGSRNPERLLTSTLGTLAEVCSCYRVLDLQVRILATALGESQTEVHETNAAFSAHGA